MTPKPENPAAFASCAASPMGDVYHQEGLSMRDYFAGQALIGIMSQLRYNPDEYYMLVGAAYAIADAMLAERSKNDAEK